MSLNSDVTNISLRFESFPTNVRMSEKNIRRITKFYHANEQTNGEISTSIGWRS